MKPSRCERKARRLKRNESTKILLKIKELNSGYNFFLHYSPYNEISPEKEISAEKAIHINKDDSLHFHYEFTPRVANFAGFEISTDMTINSVSPEEAAKFYRGE